MHMISVISPCYNAEQYIRRYIESMLSQTFPDWELILIDDGSSDRTGMICDEYAAGDSRIRVTHKENGGVSEARNVGLSQSKGTFVAFFDADDWLEPDMLKRVHDACVRTGCDMAACDVYYVSQDELGRIVEQPNHKWGALQEDRIVTGKEMFYRIFLKSATLWNKLFSAEVVKEIRFDKDKHYGEDTDFLLRAMGKVRSAVLLPYVGYHYFCNRPGNVYSADVDERSLELLENAKQVYQSFAKMGLNALGVHRISVAVMEVLRKIPLEKLEDISMKKYINACGAAARYPSAADRRLYFLDHHFSGESKRRYWMNVFSPGFRSKWKLMKRRLFRK